MIPPRGRWLTGAGLLGMLCVPLSAPPPARAQAALNADKAYWYEDIYKPFFAEEKGIMVSQRPRSRPQSFPRRKTAGTTRVFVLGGSVGYQYDGDARQSHGWNLRKVLESAFPGGRFEIIHCGMGGYDSYREDLILREILGYEPDAVVLLSGNNEVTEFSGPPPSRRLELPWKKASEAAVGTARADLQVERFDRTVRGMVRRAKRRRVSMVLCTMPRQSGLPPPGALPRDDEFLKAWILVQEGRLSEAEKAFHSLNRRRPEDPFGSFWLGRLREKRGDAAGARREYARALRADWSRVWEINDRIRRIAEEEGAGLADVEKVFDGAAPGPRNGHLVYDAMHWNRFADPMVSLAIARALGAVPPPGLGGLFAPKALPALRGAFKRLGPTDEERAEIFRRKALGAIWESPLGAGFFNERSVGALENLGLEQPRPFKDLLRRKEDFTDHLGVWTESRREEWASRWALGLAHAGEALRRLGRYKESLVYFEAARRAGCPRPIVEVHQALARKALGSGGKGIRALILEAYGLPAQDRPPPSELHGDDGDYRKPRELPAGSEDAYRLALERQGRKEYKSALELLDGLIKAHPSTAVFYNDRGACRYLDGAENAAIDDFRRAMKLDPGLLSAYSSLASIYAARKQFREALSVYDLAIARNPGRKDDLELKTIRRDREAVARR